VNDYEREVAQALEKKGWTVLTKGWPDFMVTNWPLEWIDNPPNLHLSKVREMVAASGRADMRAFAVEIKRGGDKVSLDQKRMHFILNRAGFPCQVAREDGVEAMLRRKGAIFAAPLARTRILEEIKRMEESLVEARYELQGRVEALADLKRRVLASTVLFDGSVPEEHFVDPAADGSHLPQPIADEPTGTDG